MRYTNNLTTEAINLLRRHNLLKSLVRAEIVEGAVKDIEVDKKITDKAWDKYLKENNLYEDILNESREIPEFETDDQVFCTCFGVDVYNRDEELISEYEYAKTL